MGIGVTGDFFPLGFFPIIEDTYIKGCYRAFDTIVDRDAIPTLDRKVGMLVRTDATGQVWRLNGGITNADWVLDSGSTPSTSITNIYVSGLNGSDANDGLTPGTAVATWARAMALIPSVLAAPLVIHLGAAGAPGVPYTWTPMPTPLQLNATARIWVYGDGAGQAGEDGFDVVTTGAAAAGTTAQQITLAAPVVANVYQHFTLEITSGPATGYRRTIQQNTTTQIYPCRQYEDQAGVVGVGTTPVIGNTFRILRPSVIFTGIDALTDGQPGFLANVGQGDGFAPLFLVNLAFASTSTSVEINDCSVYMAGVEFRGSAFPSISNCTGSIGWWDNLNSAVSGRLPFNLPKSTYIDTAKSQWFVDIGMSAALARLAEWRGWGASTPDITAVSSNALRFYGCELGVIGTFARVDAYGCFNFGLGGFFWGGMLVADGTYCAGLPQNITTINGVVSRATIDVVDDAFYASYGQHDINVATGSAISIQRRSFAILGDVSTLSAASWCVDVADYSGFSARNGIITAGAVGGLRASSESTFVDMYSVTNTAPSCIQLVNSRYSSQLGGAIAHTPSVATGRCLNLSRSSVMNILDTITAGGAGGLPSVLSNGSAFYSSGNITIGGITGAALSLTENSIFFGSGTISLTSISAVALSIVDSIGILSGAVTLSGSGSAFAFQNSTITLGDFTTTGTGGGTILSQSKVSFNGVTVIAGALTVLTQSFVSASGDFTITGVTGTALTLTSSCFEHISGTLTLSATSRAANLLSGSRLVTSGSSVASLTSTVSVALLVNVNSIAIFGGTSVTFSGVSNAIEVSSGCLDLACTTTVSAGGFRFTRNSSINLYVSVSMPGTNIQVEESSFISSAALTLTGAGFLRAFTSKLDLSTFTGGTQGVLIEEDSTCTFNNAATITGNLRATYNSHYHLKGSLLTTPFLELRHQSSLTQNGALTIAATGIGIRLQENSKFTQAGATLTITSPAGDGIIAIACDVWLEGAALTSITAGGAGNVGIRSFGGSRVSLINAPSSVAGPAGADLLVGGGVAVASAIIAASFSFITDADVTGLLGGFNTIGRAG